jgi:endonuclease/exonuclease/phosphatase family metal-dependent hydrolase
MAHVLGVMTRNLYLGADLRAVMRARSERELRAAVTLAWAMVRRNDFRARAEALAAEIAACGPALVGLQEACTWRTEGPAGGEIAYDYVSDLLAAASRLGMSYRSVAQVELLDFQARTLSGEQVRLTDRCSILARDDVPVANPAGSVYQHMMTVRLPGATFPVKRGHAAVDVKAGTESIRFVSTHLEGFDPAVRDAQAEELAAALSAETRPVILAADLNSAPGEGGAAVLARAGFQDTWAARHGELPGLTCCLGEDLRSAGGSFSERIDYVLTRGVLQAQSVLVTGQDAALRRGGLWPSDHGGVYAELRVG